MKFVSGNGQRERISLGAPIGSGKEAEVFDVVGLAGCAAKIYRSDHASEIKSRRAKIEAMLARSPEKRSVSTGGRDLPLLAWPTHVVEGDDGSLAGFLMAKIPSDQAVSLVSYMSGKAIARALTPDDRSLPRRLMVCRNLAGVMAELHRQGHYVVDFKPENLKVFKGSGIPCILDTDSFSIAACEGQQFPAPMYTPEYACPELLANKAGPSGVVNDLQDRFALAVLMFRVLNKGIHPFQGVPSGEREQNTWEQAIREGHYAYGLVANDHIRPSPGSAHDCLPLETRRLFDRAFQSDSPDARPPAREWKDHFESLRKTAAAFAKCDRRPDDVLHIHFADLPCAECRDTDVQEKRSRSASAPLVGSATGNSAASASPPSASPTGRRVLIALVWLAAAIFVFFLLFGCSKASAAPAHVPAGPLVTSAAVAGGRAGLAIRSHVLSPRFLRSGWRERHWSIQAGRKS